MANEETEDAERSCAPGPISAINFRDRQAHALDQVQIISKNDPVLSRLHDHFMVGQWYATLETIGRLAEPWQRSED